MNINTKDNSRPFVFIRCLTYNHEKFIENTLKGFVMQRTDFPFLAVVIDDFSTDGTADIIRTYERQYPDIIKGIYLPYNHRQVKADKRKYYQEYINKATYWAECEGDDYWTDPLKLQKQVDFLESHPDYSVTFHRCIHVKAETGETTQDACGPLFKHGEVGVDVDLFLSNWYTQPLSIVFRIKNFDFDDRNRYKYYRDMHQIYNLLKNGKGYIFSFVGGVRTIHPGGIASMISKKEYCDISLPMDGEFYRKTKEKGAKKIYIDTLGLCVRTYSESNKSLAFKCACERLWVSHGIKQFINDMTYIIRG